MICSYCAAAPVPEVPGSGMYQPYCLLCEQVLVSAQQIEFDEIVRTFVPAPKVVAFEMLVMTCCSSEEVEIAGFGAAARLSICVDDRAFQAAMFQSQIPYRACVPVEYVDGLVLVCGTCCPVPNSTITRGSPVCGVMATTAAVVIGWPDGVVNSGVVEAFHCDGLVDVRSKRQSLPLTSPA